MDKWVLPVVQEWSCGIGDLSRRTANTAVTSGSSAGCWAASAWVLVPSSDTGSTGVVPIIGSSVEKVIIAVERIPSCAIGFGSAIKHDLRFSSPEANEHCTLGPISSFQGFTNCLVPTKY